MIINIKIHIYRCIEREGDRERREIIVKRTKGKINQSHLRLQIDGSKCSP